MRKKIVLGILFTMLVIINPKSALAETDNYEKINIKFKKEIINTDEYIPSEVIDDYYGMKSIIRLKTKTNSKFEIGISKEDSNYKFIKSVETYNEAIKIIKELNVSDNEIPIILNEDGEIIYSTQSIGRIVNLYNGNPEYTTNHVIKIYPTEKSNNHITYINSGYVDDVPILSYGNSRVKILVNGVEGWINIYEEQYKNIEIVPLNQAINLSYYEKNSNGDLVHYISTDITNKNKGHKIIIGKSPDWMEINKKYYSYDGSYFYQSIENLLLDRINSNYNNSINKSNKYYNYYSYLSGRSKIVYSANELNNYLNNNTPSNSILRNTGKYFIEAQDKYGVNAGIMLGIAMNESAKGTSNIAINKNNIFGLNAIDSDTGQADKFNSVKDCISDFAKNWMSTKYFNPKNWVYSGASLGNKNVGINVQYASDPFWGEKAARYCYDVNKYLGNKDILNYKIGIYKAEDKVLSSSGEILYNVLKDKNKSAKIGYPVIVMSENNSNYFINPDTQNRNDIGIYNWSEYGNISKSSIELINNGEWIFEDGYYYYKDHLGNKVVNWKQIDGFWYYFNGYGQMQVGWQRINDKWYYFDIYGQMKTGWQCVDERWYYMYDSGAMATGWINLEGTWYYLYEWGEMATGWIKIENIWYYLYDSGKMATGWINLEGTWYYLNDWGAMATGWLELNERKYYLYEWGAMATGWLNLEGVKYYLNSYGEVTTGWQYIDENWYYMYWDGVMATNTTIGNWQIDSNGIATII